MEILEKVPIVVGPRPDEEDRNLVLLMLQPVYLQALEVLNRSIRYHHSPATTTTSTTTTTTTTTTREPSSCSSVLLQSLRETAVKLYQDCPTESVRARAIAVCSFIDDRQNHTTLIELLSSPQYPPPGIGTINAALAALARDKDWVLARAVLFHHASLVSTMSCNIVLLAMERAQQGTAALELLEHML
jgi:hypothetical protein